MAVWAWIVAQAVLWGLMILAMPAWGARHALARAPTVPRSVRVCVPARDEAAHIVACVAAIRASAPSAEIVVVDDDSQDGTGALAATAASEVVVRRTSGRPSGWSGKAWACQQAAEDARTDWLLFVDADVRLASGAVDAMIAAAETDGRDLLSLFGTWRLESFWERVAIPAIGWFIRGSIDLDAVERGERAFANGQALLVRRSAWSAWGGHSAVRSTVLDDVGLARVARAAGHPIGVRYAPWAFEVRLYDGLPAILAGYGKNLFEGMDRRLGVAVAAAFLVLLSSVVPPLLIPAGLALGDPALAAGGAALWALESAFRWTVERKDGRSGWVAPLHPLGAGVLVLAILRSIRPITRWKGRVFDRGASR